MKKKYFLIPLLLLVAVGVVAIQARASVDPSNKIETKSFNFSNFDEIRVTDSFDVEYVQSTGNTWSVEVTAPDNIIPYVVVKRHEEGISLSLKGVSTDKDFTLKAKIVAPALEEINISGASSFSANEINVHSLDLEASGASYFNIKKIASSDLEIKLTGASATNIEGVDTGEFDLDLSGASKADIKIKTGEADVELSGASVATLSGNVGNVEMEASGASTINAKSFNANNGSLQASGASKIDANVANLRHQRATGGSTINNN